MFRYLFMEDIIFYQRPLKSKKSTIAGCQYESRKYTKKNKKGIEETIKQPLKVISKSNPLFIEFRLWQFLRNLKIYKIEGKNDVDITDYCLRSEEEWCDLFDFLNDKKEVEQKNIIDYLIKVKRLEREQKENYRWNYVVDKKYPINETRSLIISRLKNVENIPNNFILSKEIEKKLWHLIYSITDKNEFITALATFALKNNFDKESFVRSFEKFPPFKAEYGSYSEKAIKKLLPLMRMGKYWNEDDIISDAKNRIVAINERIKHLQVSDDEKIDEKKLSEAISLVSDDEIPSKFIKSFLKLKDKNPLSGLNTYQACYAVYERHSEVNVIQQWKTPTDINNYLFEFKQHSLRNPIVEQVILETLRTVRDIWEFNLENDPDFKFSEIHLELGRDIKNSADKRKKIASKQNENENNRIKLLLHELKNNYTKEDIRPFSPNHQEILKIYEEGVYQNPKTSFNTVSEEEISKIRKNTSPTATEITRYRLWLEQNYISPYTGHPIPLSKLFSSDYQIEHIIPQSRYFDNSLSNKVICESAVNELKSNQTAYEFLKNSPEQIVNLGNGKTVKLLSLESYIAHCENYFKNNRAKLKNLLSEDVPEGFINRQMNDSRYINKFIKGLLSNIVREENEKEATAKNLVPVSGAITSKLKQDWELNEVWNELITPRFKRLNQITNSQDYGYIDFQKDKNGNNTGKEFFRTKSPTNVHKKRIDHRHHALDALVIACCTKDHVNYISSLETERTNYSLVNKLRHQKKIQRLNKKGELVTKKIATTYKKPWSSFRDDAKEKLDTIIVSFKKNTRVINKATNKYLSYKDEQGNLRLDKNKNPKKAITQQTKGKNWAIRKPLHTPLPYGKNQYNFTILEICKNVRNRNFINDKIIKVKVNDIFIEKNSKVGDTQKYLKKHPISINGEVIKYTIFNLPQKRYRKRKPINTLSNRGQGGIKTLRNALDFINKISDIGIRNDLLNHLKEHKNDIDIAFSVQGLEQFNIERKIPVFRLPISEYSEGKFPIGVNKKYGEAESGTNLFFAIYWNEDQQKREFETLPLNEVIEHQKWRATLTKEERKETPLIPIKPSKGKFLFSLSPNDLVYVPTSEEIENSKNIDFDNLTKERASQVYKMVSSTNKQCFFLNNRVSSPIKNKLEFSALNKMEKTIEGIMVKNVCWKLVVDRLGNIIKVIK
ncbi:HNH endonuclease domain-containing protein [Tenacibaculum tangerinum]|uniref:CRISPR-associated endonuclease Cas9 n=1 Tax=Tenacibaculum tangerinum TaxID=3038772 RepID=A0ABY8L6K1_9FLAO|nr:type II CRISPR RNA-guided endonuclease Cas9 [Tenacibaculum tangerinum]WGH77020.1 HNH endonuclease domain-containing protein [Tenacibaculum tangerinum]